VSHDDAEAIAWAGSRCEAALVRGDAASAAFWSSLAFTAVRVPGWVVPVTVTPPRAGVSR
jgi:hypothetical protein